MKTNIYKNSAILIALIIMIGFFFYAQNKRFLSNNSQTSREHKEYIVVEGENDFSPNPITINQGDTINFKTIRGKLFWPASNLHPTHEIYPEFDPLKPIESNSSWSFQFNKVGEWRYHDHLAPFLTGTITVNN